MEDNTIRDLKLFLDRETPGYDGCLVCRVKRSDRDTPEFLLIQRAGFANGDSFIINRRMFYDYDFVWRDNPNWEILWKFEG